MVSDECAELDTPGMPRSIPGHYGGSMGRKKRAAVSGGF
jgi:hypothetical protein